VIDGLDLFFYWFKEVPDVVWSGIIASAITLLGVVFADHKNTRRLMLQQCHVATENAKDRVTKLRQEVYLPAAAEFSRLVSFIGAMPRLSSDELTAAEPLQTFAARATQLAVVSEPATALLAGEIATAYSILYMKMLPLAMAITETETAIGVRTEILDTIKRDLDRVLLEMKVLNESGVADDVKMSALSRQFDSAREMQRRWFSERDELGRKKVGQIAAFGRELLPALQQQLEGNLRLAMSLRSDLGQTGDQDQFYQAMRANAKSASDVAIEIVDEVERKVMAESA
jgi:hypothetical protein